MVKALFAAAKSPAVFYDLEILGRLEPSLILILQCVVRLEIVLTAFTPITFYSLTEGEALE